MEIKQNPRSTQLKRKAYDDEDTHKNEAIFFLHCESLYIQKIDGSD